MNKEHQDMVKFHLDRIRKILNGTLNYDQRIEAMVKLDEFAMELRKVIRDE